MMQFKLKTITFALIASGVLLNTHLAVADDAADLQALKQTIQELDQKIKILERKNEIADEEAVNKKKETPVVIAGESGFSIKSADNNFQYNLKGLLQFDYRTYNQATLKQGAANGFDVRLIRPTFDGTIFGNYDFNFTPEFGESDNQSSGTNGNPGAGTNNKVRIIDAYVIGRYAPWLNIQAGKFKPVVGLERLQANQDTKWIERSYVSNNIVPNRDLGLSVAGDLLDRKLNYAVGLYNGVIDGGESSTGPDGNNNKDIALRLFANPFKNSGNELLEGLGLGIATTYGSANGTTTNTALPAYKTPGQVLNFFSYSNSRAAGTHLRWVPQAYYYNGSLGLMAEYAGVSQEIAGTATNNLNQRTSLTNDAWEVSASYLLTGENASFKGVKPRSSFDTNTGGWGAWELIARYQENNIDDNAFSTTTTTRFANPTTSAKSGKTWGVGINWYLNQWVRVASNYEQTSFNGGGGGTVANPLDRADERIFFSRLQLSF